MEKHNVIFFESDSANSLGDMVSSWMGRYDVNIINVSHSSCYDYEKKCVSYSVAIAYSIED